MQEAAAVQGAKAVKGNRSVQIANVTSCPTPMHSMTQIGRAVGPQNLDLPVSSVPAVVCAACPPEHEVQVSDVCRQQKVMKAFGRYTSDAGMQNWVQQWQAQVVQAVAGLVAERDATRARILCIEGGPDCGQQMAAQQHIVSMIRKELSDASFPIRVEWMPIADFWVEFGMSADRVCSSTSSPLDTSNYEAKRGARERTPSVLRLRKESLTAIWVCEECQAYFDTKQNLVDHQQSESHWGPLCEDNGRHLIRESDFEALEAGDVVIADAVEEAETAGCNAALPVPPIKLADANDDGCVVFNLDSPRQEKDKAAPMTHKAVADPSKAKLIPRVALGKGIGKTGGMNAEKGPTPRTPREAGQDADKRAQAPQTPPSAATRNSRPMVSFEPTPRPNRASPVRRGRNQNSENQARCRSASGLQQPDGASGTRSQNSHASTSTSVEFNPDLDPRSWPSLGAAIARGPRPRSLSVPRQKRR